VHHVTEWKYGGATDITNEDLACDSCHALVHDGPGGWKTRVAPPDAAHPGRVEWIAPPHIDPDRRPRINHRHHMDHFVAGALARHRYRRERPSRRGASGTTRSDDNGPHP
jgi:hypothetical protein